MIETTALENKLTPRIVYRADVTNNKTDEHKLTNITIVSQTLLKRTL